MSDAACKFNKYGHCKYGRYCNFRHVNKKCDKINCDIKTCDYRHPKYCRYILQHSTCKFQEYCSFEHEIEDLERFETKQSQPDKKRVEEKIEELKRVIISKDVKIGILETKIMKLEKCNYEEDSDESDGDYSNENLFDENKSVDSDSETDNLAIDTDEEEFAVENDASIEEKYYCDRCDYTTTKKIGVSIHRTKKHKHFCAGCAKDFIEPTELKRHNCEVVENFENPTYENYFIEKRKQENQCFNIMKNKLSFKKPISILHTENCWHDPSTSCSDLNTISPAPSKDSAFLDMEGLLHMCVTSVIINRVVDWDDLFRSFVGFGVD